MVGEDDLVELDLSDDEWNLLFQGVHQLAGPTAVLDDAISQVIGYRDREELGDHYSTLVAEVKACGPLSRRDWRRALTATEITFASGYYGAASDWEVCSMLDDASTITLLRRLQRKLIPVIGRSSGP